MHHKVLIETQFFPPIRTFASFWRASEIIIEGHENYQKRSFRNRAYVATSQGRMMLSVPLTKGKNNKMPIKEATISQEEPWQHEMKQTLHTAYHNAPYYPFYGTQIDKLIETNTDSLWKLNNTILVWCMEVIDMSRFISFSSSYIQTVTDDSQDLRGSYLPNSHHWKDSAKNVYRQVHEDRTGFIPYLSIIDLIMCLGPESITYLREVAAHTND